MNNRILCMETTSLQYVSSRLSFFPFTQGGICSQLPPSYYLPLREPHFLEGDFTLRLASVQDMARLFPLLDSYGNNPQNYPDLELFLSEKWEIVARNMSQCSLHRFFISFLLCKETIPIGFFQIDPYSPHTILDLFKNKLFLTWNTFFKEPLSWDQISLSSDIELQENLSEKFNGKAWSAFCKQRGIVADAPKWLHFIYHSLITCKTLLNQLTAEQWVGNISYNLLPEYQHRGLMSQILQIIQSLLSKINCAYLFSDRIAILNYASIALLKKNNFTVSPSFMAYYGPEYHTRNHPCGNFSETCIGFFKKIS